MHTNLSPLPIIPLGTYRHYKGGEYSVLSIGRLEATEEPVVIYRALYDAPDAGSGAIWVRPVASFLETVIVDGHTLPRFTYVHANSISPPLPPLS